MENEILKINDVADVFSALPKINATATFWMVRANKGDYYLDFVMRQYVGIGFDEISLSEAQEKTNEQLTTLFKQRKPKDEFGKEIPAGTYTTWVGQLKRFANELKPGDYVLVPSDSSERFSFGVITDLPRELTDSEVNEFSEVEGRKNSPYKKRLSVQFLKSFNRQDADPALYKMIYTQTTLSKIDKYSAYILRAAYDAYISENNIFLSFPVKQKENIKGRPFTKFTYNLTEGFYELSKEDLVIKSNVQSEGVVQLVLGLSAMSGLFLLLIVVLKSKKGFTVEANLRSGKFKFTKENDGIVAERILDSQQSRKITDQEADDAHLARTIAMMNTAGFSMEEIQAKISNELREATKKADSPDEESDQD
ncbi:hypothetical protein FC70_GL000505 [Paucilactobacillus oligofermentans DSM 15707 = LMG 22743]|uniref:Uncharacterized protein n=1 Tax=Paucilactobacillus oligofermentans DSM 15707 = LMG 22743 TaxID=1423778 RepID=A0A0R1RFX3_9LACO|nr:hypothetical protein [Paucilactobacillus oligofermentans]KRL55920.1 hypothetical protein FC70_GL000505 [Paucilactobacillus oligofermentans DSM 15707 = LMG 22743]CUS26099.1 Uncharacterized protein LACOL_0791 [Paucilactobacillus oligofermentans DSM 15707 = LMG 22743]